MSTFTSGRPALSFEMLTRSVGLKADERLTTTVTIRQASVFKRTVFIEVKSPAVHGHPLTMKGEVSVDRMNGEFKISSVVNTLSGTKVTGSHIQYLASVTSRMTDLVQKTQDMLTQAFCLFRGHALKGPCVAASYESDLRYPELKAILAGMLDTDEGPTLGELLTNSTFDYEMQVGVEAEIKDNPISPLNKVLTQIARHRGILSDQEFARDHFERVKSGLVA